VFSVSDPAPIDVEIAANGEASVLVDGTEVASTSAGTTDRATVAAGAHRAVVRYRKPAGITAVLSVSLRHAGTGQALEVFPAGVDPRSRPMVDLFAVAIDVIVLLTLLAVTAITLLAAWRSEYRVQAMVGATVVIGLGVQGYLTALPNAYQFRTLTGGDDWLGFESRSRDILQNGPLMTLGAPLGEGAAYFYHPFYPYVLALVHAVTGESLFGPIFIHFLILAATALLMWSFARSLFGTVAASCALVALLIVFELDFIRYYTITLLSENLYVLTVTLCLMAFARWARTGRVALLIQAGGWAGISAATRPAMMMFLLPALAVTVAIAFRQRRGWWPWHAAGIAGASWMAVVLPFTIRNWIVARRLVLISDGLGGGFIAHNVPPGVDAVPYLDSYAGGIGNSLAVLWRVAIEHPVAVASLQLQKLGFTLGMVHWFDGYRPHPELVAISLLYLLMMVMSPVMRRAEVWPIHAFVLSHVASMALTSPWNYGYRLILPPFVYTTTLSVAAAAAMLINVQARRAARS
jgi:3-dehydroquinate dehydratase